MDSPSRASRRGTGGRTLTSRTLADTDFLWLLLRHVLPKGLRRARNYGFLHPNSKRLIQLLLTIAMPGRTPALGCRDPPVR
jgi:hypothetical protein